jgi:hypothetical protein
MAEILIADAAHRVCTVRRDSRPPVRIRNRYNQQPAAVNAILQEQVCIAGKISARFDNAHKI